MHPVRNPAGWLVLPLIAVSFPAGAQAQGTYQPYAAAPARGKATSRAESALSHQLTILANNPNSVPALTGAGKAALELGDAEAALTFFGRAEELSPQDGMIKAGLGCALTMMEQPEAALQFFYEAIRRGVPASEFAAYRGLAYDLVGDPQHAQQDYQLELRRREHPEVRRRLALSMAISGQRDAALTVIEPQLRWQDRAAWRTRAFILALSGDTQGATRAVELAMPSQASAMAPFLARLPTLSLADRARAVHFGHFPGEPSAASSFAAATAARASATGNGPPPRKDPDTSAGRPDATQRPLGQPLAAAPTSSVASASSSATRTASQASPSAGIGPPVAPRSPSSATAAAPPKMAPSRTAGPARPAIPTLNLTDIATLIAGLTDPPPAVKPGSPGLAMARAETPIQDKIGRTWVQISRSRNELGLASEYRRIKARAPDLFADKPAWTTPVGPTNRLLVGPFESDKEAQDFVNQVKRTGVYAFSWTSAAGQEIKKLPAK